MKLQWPTPDVHLSPAMGPDQYEKYISQVFGANPSNYAQFGYKGHNGLDIAMPTGTVLSAVHDGWVVFADATNGPYGVRLELVFQEGDQWYMILYGHLQKVLISPHTSFNFFDRSTPVKAGDPICVSNNTGNSTGPHLHLSPFKLDNQGNILDQNNGFGGAFDILPYFQGDSMQLVRFNGTVYRVSGVNNKKVVGIAAQIDLEDLYGDEPINDVASLPVLESWTESPGYMYNKKN